MLTIITGTINSYKTTKLKNLYETNHKGDGYISVKTMKDNKVLYYELQRLSDGYKQKFIIHTEHYPNQFEKVEKLGPYVFDLAYLKEVNQYLRQLIKQGKEPIFLDEIGMLETQKKMFYPILNELVDSNLDVYITVRESLVDTIVSLLNIKVYNVIT